MDLMLISLSIKVFEFEFEFRLFKEDDEEKTLHRIYVRQGLPHSVSDCSKKRKKTRYHTHNVCETGNTYLILFSTVRSRRRIRQDITHTVCEGEAKEHKTSHTMFVKEKGYKTRCHT